MPESKPAPRQENLSTTRKVRVWSKGQFTIPAEIRERLEIKENTILGVFQAGRAIIATPEKLLVKELASSVYEEIDKKGIDIKELLEELREGSHEYETD